MEDVGLRKMRSREVLHAEGCEAKSSATSKGLWVVQK